jgi:hypothetical protein
MSSNGLIPSGLPTKPLHVFIATPEPNNTWWRVRNLEAEGLVVA